MPANSSEYMKEYMKKYNSDNKQKTNKYQRSLLLKSRKNNIRLIVNECHIIYFELFF